MIIRMLFQTWDMRATHDKYAFMALADFSNQD